MLVIKNRMPIAVLHPKEVMGMIKKAWIGILLMIILFFAGCAGYSNNYRYNPYSEYYHYPYRYHGAPYGYQGHGYRGGWQHF